MAHKSGWIHRLQWGNIHTTPPNGLPKVLGEWKDREPSIEDFKTVYPDYRLGCGFGHFITFPTVKRKPFSEAVKKRMRERRNKTKKANWLKKNMPLLANQIIKEEKLDWRNEFK